MEYSLKDTLKEIEKSLPKEPDGEGISITIHFIDSSNGNLFSRRFLSSNKIQVNFFIYNNVIIYLYLSYSRDLAYIKLRILFIYFYKMTFVLCIMYLGFVQLL